MNFPLFMALLLVCSRGGLELFLPKALAYLISFSGFFLFVVFFYFKSKAIFRFGLPVILLSLVFLISSLISLLATMAGGADINYIYYYVYPLCISVSFLVFYSARLQVFDAKEVGVSLCALISILFSVGLLQQLNFIDLPGSTPMYGLPLDLVRPSSLTGSYLHYPLVMILLGAFLHAIRRKLGFFSFIAYISVFASLSRSGMLLVALIFLFLLVGALRHSSMYKLRLRLALNFSFVFMGCFILLATTGFGDFIWQRASSAFSQDGIGNESRMDAWRYGLEVFSTSDVWFGSNFGHATNLTANLVGGDSYVVESGVIQNLINFGLVGSFIFFLFFLYNFFRSRESVFSCFILAFVIQSFVYQSIEVLPLIIGAFFFGSLVFSEVNSGKFALYVYEPNSQLR